RCLGSSLWTNEVSSLTRLVERWIAEIFREFAADRDATDIKGEVSCRGITGILKCDTYKSWMIGLRDVWFATTADYESFLGVNEGTRAIYERLFHQLPLLIVNICLITNYSQNQRTKYDRQPDLHKFFTRA